MRILVTYLHYAKNEGGDARHASLREDTYPERAEALKRSILHLHGLFGPRQAEVNYQEIMAKPFASTTRVEALDVVVVVSGDNHLLEMVDLPHYMLKIAQFNPKNPRTLGWHAHHVMKRHHEHEPYDIYAYIEDDITIHDPQFFLKQLHFFKTFDHKYVLMPNRFEFSAHDPAHKVYVDGPFQKAIPKFRHRTYDEEPPPNLIVENDLEDIHFELAPYPHSGSFFVSRQQMDVLTQSKFFGIARDHMYSYMASSGALHLLPHFPIYKPAPPTMHYLETHHEGTGFAKLVGRPNIPIDFNATETFGKNLYYKKSVEKR